MGLPSNIQLGDYIRRRSDGEVFKVINIQPGLVSAESLSDSNIELRFDAESVELYIGGQFVYLMLCDEGDFELITEGEAMAWLLSQ